MTLAVLPRAAAMEMSPRRSDPAARNVGAVWRELPPGDCFADSTPLGFNTNQIPHFKTPKKKIQTRSCRHKALSCRPLGLTIEKDLAGPVNLGGALS